MKLKSTKQPVNRASILNNYREALDLVSNANELKIYDLMAELSANQLDNANVHWREELEENYFQVRKDIENL